MTKVESVGAEHRPSPNNRTPRLDRVLFLGSVSPPLAWYRVVGPAKALGADWVRYRGDPPHTALAALSVRGGQYQPPNYDDYQTIVVQQPEREAWRDQISAWQDGNKRVLIDIDDAIYDIQSLESHAGRHSFGPERIEGYEHCLKVASGLIVSTQRLRELYAPLNPNVWVCRNGVDVERFTFTPVERDTVNIGWSGASGHKEALDAWWPAVVQAMLERPEARLVTLGSAYAEPLWRYLPGRILSIPYLTVEQHAAAYANFDLALAPASKHSWHMGKSDLRWLESSAAGLPCIADPVVYDDIEPGVTGWWAEDPQQVYEALIRLIDDRALRLAMGARAREYVSEHRSMEAAAESWSACLSALR